MQTDSFYPDRVVVKVDGVEVSFTADELLGHLEDHSGAPGRDQVVALGYLSRIIGATVESGDEVRALELEQLVAARQRN